jgi:parvulin-like peptidyl-prolyl isomerase
LRSLKLVILLVLGAALLALAAACGGDGTDAAGTEPASTVEVPADAIAVVDGTPVAKADFDRLFRQAEAAYEAQGRDFPQAGTPEYEALKTDTVEFLVDRVIREKEAVTLGISVTDDEVDQRLTELKQQFFEGDEQKYQDELKAQNVTDADVRADLKAQILSQRIFDEVTKNETVTDADIKTYYDNHVDEFTTPESRAVAHILVAETDKKLADDLYQQLQDGANFAALAKKYSTDTGSAADGGKLTDVRGQFVPEFEEVAFALKTGEVGKPVKSQFGWHIIKALGDTKPETVTPFEDVKDTIKDQLVKEKQTAAMSTWVADARAKYEDQIGYATGFQPATTTTIPTDTGAVETG